MTWVEEGIFAAGGNFLPEHWGEFAAQTGLTAILHLRPGSPARFEGPTPAAFLWLPLESEDEAGTAERWLAGSFVAAQRAEGRRVLLHSSVGLHRSRWTFVAYRILGGATARAAVRQAEVVPWQSPYHTDLAAWEEFARQVRERRRTTGRRIRRRGG
jgi:hypothetical protein